MWVGASIPGPSTEGSVNLSSLSTVRKLTAAAQTDITTLRFITGSAITFGAQCASTGRRQCVDFEANFVLPMQGQVIGAKSSVSVPTPNTQNPTPTQGSIVDHASGKRRIRAILLLHELSRTGAPKIAIEAFESLRDRVDTLAISLQHGEMEGAVTAFAPLHVLPEPPSTSVTPKEPGFFEKRAMERERRVWADRFAAFNADIIYANSVASLPVAHFVQLPDLPVLLHVHELDMLIEWYDRLNPYRTRQWPTRFIAVADAVKEVLVNSLGIDPDKVARVPEFFDESTLQRAISSIPPRVQTEGRPFVVGGAGRIQWRKGFELWLQTAAYLKEKLGATTVRFVWVGGEDDMREAEMRLTVRKLGLADCVTIIPMTGDPFSHYAEFDTFLMTSWEDPFPIVVLETMAMGKPVICVKGSGGPAEQVADTGIVVERFDASLLGEAVLRLVREPELAERFSAAARDRATRSFSKSVVVPQIFAEIERTIRIGRGGV